MARVILFRGPNTAGILADAVRMGLVAVDDEIVIVCGNDDPLAKAGDVAIGHPAGSDGQHAVRRRFRVNFGNERAGKNIIITSEESVSQVLPTVLRFTEEAIWGDDRFGRSWTWEVWEVKRDGKKQVAGDPGGRNNKCPRMLQETD